MKTLLFYSGGCRFCRAVARMLVKLDVFKQLAIIPSRSIMAEPFLGQLPDDVRYANWWILPIEGGLISGSNGGLIALLKALYWTAPLALVCKGCRLQRMLNALDRWVKAHRHILSGMVNDGHAPMVIDRSTYSLGLLAKGEYVTYEKEAA